MNSLNTSCSEVWNGSFVNITSKTECTGMVNSILNTTSVLTECVGGLNSSLLAKCVEGLNDTSDVTSTAGECSGMCIAVKVSFIFLVLGIANIVVILCVIVDKNLQNPTFLVIASLSLSEVILQISTVSRFHCKYVVCPRSLIRSDIGYLVATKIFRMTWISTALHIPFLALVRFIILVYPLRSRAWFIRRRTVAMLFMLWIFAFCVALTIEQIACESLFGNCPPIAGTIALSCFYFISGLITLCLHLIKYRVVANALSRCEDTTVKSMARMITVVVVLYILLPLPYVIYLYSVILVDIEWRETVHIIGYILFLCNTCMGPYLYSFMSSAFRKSLQNICCRRQKATDITGTTTDSTASVNVTTLSEMTHVDSI